MARALCAWAGGDVGIKKNQCGQDSLGRERGNDVPDGIYGLCSAFALLPRCQEGSARV